MLLRSLYMGFTDSLLNLPYPFSSLSPPLPFPDADRIQRTVNLFPFQWPALLWKPEFLRRSRLQTWTNGMAEFQSFSAATCCYPPTRHFIVVLTEASPAVPQTFIQIHSLFYALPMFILSLCYYFSRAPVCSRESLDLSFSHVQLDPILHPISQFCPSAGGTSWWTTVTQPPPGILMMNSATTFSFGNLPFSSFFEILTP